MKAISLTKIYTTGLFALLISMNANACPVIEAEAEDPQLHFTDPHTLPEGYMEKVRKHYTHG